jgi:peptide/nickel transport system ATP-binding protein
VTTLLELRQLSVRFAGAEGPLVAVDGVDLTIEVGSVLALVGESGCGKSLTASSLIGLGPAGAASSYSSYRFDGRSIESEAALVGLRGREIGFVFQDPLAALDPVVTVGAQLMETVRAHHPKLSRREAHERSLVLLQEAGIPDAASRFSMVPHELSGGLRQRVTLALALAGDPKLLVADEATTALDPTLRLALVAHLVSLCRSRGMAILFVTHDLGLVAHAADSIAVMYCGRIVERGPRDRVLARPEHPYTQGLLESAPSLGTVRDRLPTIAGVVPPLGLFPKGCRFAPRCDHATEPCRAELPELRPVGGSMVACVHPSSERSGASP